MIGVGSKVVCIDGEPETGAAWGQTEALIEGNVYTVRSVHNHMGNLVVWLEEVSRDTNSRRFWGDRVGYGINRFRPVRDIKTDISIFQQIDRDVFGRVDA